MLPLNAPLPTASSFPCQLTAGSQTSTWISESLDGLSVAATRQDSSILSARLIVAFGIASVASRSHADGDSPRAGATNETIARHPSSLWLMLRRPSAPRDRLS